MKSVAGVQWGQSIQTSVIGLWHTFESIWPKTWYTANLTVFLKFWSKIAILDRFKVHFFPDTLNTIKKELLKNFFLVIYDAAFIPQSVISRFIWSLKAFCRCPFFQNIYVSSLVCTRMYINVPPNMYLCTSSQALKCFQVRTQE